MVKDAKVMSADGHEDESLHSNEVNEIDQDTRRASVTSPSDISVVTASQRAGKGHAISPLSQSRFVSLPRRKTRSRLVVVIGKEDTA